MNKKPFTLHTICAGDGDEPLKAIMPTDGNDGMVIGENWEVRALRDLLDQYLTTGQHDGEIDELHEQLGFEWINTLQALELAPDIPGRTIRWAAKHGWIRGAEKDGRDWRFPKMAFTNWVRNRPKPGRK